MGTAMLAAALAIVTVMLTTWIISVLIKNASIVDIVGLRFRGRRVDRAAHGGG